MGKVLPFRRTKSDAHHDDAATTLASLLEPTFTEAIVGQPERAQHAMLRAVGRGYGVLLRRTFDEATARHFERVLCGGVHDGVAGCA
jgi:hypothetical protein